MIQGDEPMITPKMISKSLKPLLERTRIKYFEFNGIYGNN